MKKPRMLATFGGILVLGLGASAMMLGPAGSQDAATGNSPGKEAARPDEPRTMAITGEVIDLACYASSGEHGAAHRGCALDCLSKGAPMAILTAEGKVYVVSNHGDDEMARTLRARAAEIVTLNGDVADRGGVLTLNAKSASAGGEAVEPKLR